MHPILLDYGADEPLVLESSAGVASSFTPPAGVAGAEARRRVAEALAAPLHGPPLASHVVPGDRVVIAIAGTIAQAAAAVDAVRECLVSAGIAEPDVTVLTAPALGLEAPGRTAVSGGIVAAEAFDPTVASATSYLAADEAGRPLYLARALVDADVVVAVGERGWGPALGGRSIEGELWPTFARAECRRDLLVALARRGRGALADWKGGMQDIAWQLGVCASLRIVRGAAGSLMAARFGLPDEAARQARADAAAWCPASAADADVTICSLSDPDMGFGGIVAAVAAAARITRPGGTICVACRQVEPAGLILTRWRQGAPLEGLVHEAVASGDAALIADALLTRLFARGLDDRRLVLLSDLDEDAVEELEFGHAAGPESVERLVRRAERIAVLAEADRCLPKVAE
ncbi:MAG: hypothetical protein ACKO4T_10760 [Planctomycetaceae bacterium]